MPPRSDEVLDPTANAVVAVVGATGLVGETLLGVLAERRFPARRLVALASERSAGERVRFGDQEVAVREARPGAFDGVDLAFFATSATHAAALVPEARRRVALVVDKSSAFRADPAVPLVVPEVNPDALAAHAGLVASPNCTTVGLVMALEPIRRAAGLERVVVTTLQAASGAGRDGLAELEAEERELVRGRTPHHAFWPEPLARSVLPVCERLLEDGESTEEKKLRDETRRILGLAALPLDATCLRVPVPVGHGASVLVETTRPLSVAEARAAWEDFPGVRLAELPTPARVAGTDDVLVGRVRRTASGALLFWEVSDNLRKGSATNAVQIAERLLA